MVYIVMGVSGCGKTTTGNMLASEWNIPFYDADNFHPDSNVQKMTRGIPLDDNDRQPWLNILGDKIREWNKKGDAVLACSALKKTYRDRLRNRSDGKIEFIYLNGSFSIISKRIQTRTNHFMPLELLKSQFEALEEPHQALWVDTNQSPTDIVKEIITHYTL